MTVVTARTVFALTAGVLLMSPHAARRQVEHRVPTPTLMVSRSTRLMVIAPHPDDETLGAGGLIERVRTLGGEVRVVYVTDGDGYPEGVEAEDHIATPTAEDYRDYGRRRQDEAREAMKVFGMKAEALTYLAFPDGGLCTLITKYWSQRRHAYESPFTRLDRPPREDVIVRSTEYRGEDLTQELARVIGRFHPTLIVVPRKEDQHPDHCASWFFLADALTDVERVRPEIRPDVVNYIVHFKEWPFQSDGPGLPPPPGLRGGLSGWMRFPLTAKEQQAKRDALKRYRSQVDVMAWFLDGFARTNELFSRPAPPHLYLPLRRSPCDCDR